MSAPGPQASVSVVIPVWNGRRWLDACLASLAAQTHRPDEVIAVDNGSTDGSLELLRADHPSIRVLELGRNTGFAHAVNRGIEACATEWVALINTDIVLEADWISRTVGAAGPGDAAIACKMLLLADPARIYDAGDVLRRDGACEQRGRFMADDGRWNQPGEVFGACAGAALYRRSAVVSVGGFDERYFAYLEDVDLALRLRLRGWSCRYEPVSALHAGEGSSSGLPGGHHALVMRNTVYLIAKSFPVRWLPYVAYRQCGWAWHAWREGRLRAHARALLAALPMLPPAWGERRGLRRSATVSIEAVVPARRFWGQGVSPPAMPEGHHE